MTTPTIEHLLVLMMENRSFDHMLGYLEYPDGVPFEGLSGREGELGNPLANGDLVHPGAQASYATHPGPGHSHEDVMVQLLGNRERGRPYQLRNDGFAANYDANYNPGRGELAVQCFRPGQLPVLATLAREFAVLDHWFCSVPGATWPNRNFAHAATSDGEVNIHTRAYHNKTIFEQLSEAGLDWAIYYGGFPPQSLAFSNLWLPSRLNWLQRFKPIEQLYRAIRHDRLPHYAFIEPDMVGKLSESQHPGMGGEEDFRAAERFIWRLYTALRENPAVFDKTLLLITYDEHGGFFDHVPPPQGEKWQVEPPYRSGDYSFPFDLLGPRVPAVLVSPRIAPGTVDQTVYEHASIPATVRRLFQLKAPPLSSRERVTNSFEQAANLEAPRIELPDLPEPFVDDAARRLIEEPDLRNSLIGVLVDVVWTELRNEGAGAKGLLETAPTGDFADPDELEREIMLEIAPQLSPEAQQVLAETAVEAELGAKGLPGTESFLAPRTALNMLRHKAERLAENLALVDDLMRFVELVLRRFVEGEQTILRTADGRAVEQPDRAALERALAALFALHEPGARLWLADHKERWLTVWADGRATLHEVEPERALPLGEVGPEEGLALLEAFQAGRL